MILKDKIPGIVTFLIVAATLLGLGLAARHYKDKAERAEVEAKFLMSKFEGCRQSIMQLHEQTQEREEKAAKALKEAQSMAADYQLRADKLLRQPAAVPGDDCASARVRAHNWLEQRK